MRCWAFPGQGPWPGVVVVHDAVGYVPDNKLISERIARAGYVVLTPNMYARGGRARCITRVFRELLTKRGRALDDILAARDHLLAMPECSGRVGIVGFAWAVSLRLSCRPEVLAPPRPLRHSTAAPPQRDAKRGMPDRRQLRHPRPAGYRRSQSTT